jgi:hypothetical protein
VYEDGTKVMIDDEMAYVHLAHVWGGRRYDGGIIIAMMCGEFMIKLTYLMAFSIIQNCGYIHE